MPKSKGIRDVQLNKQANELLNRHIDYAVKHGLATKDEVMELYYGVWEAGNKHAEQLLERGMDDMYAQLAAVDSVKAVLGRKVTKPKYTVHTNVINVRHAEYEDENNKNKKHPSVHIFAQVQLISDKGIKTEEKFAEINAFKEHAFKIADVEEGKTYMIEAATGYTDGDVLNLSVDDRCGEAVTTDETLSNVEKLMTELFNITPISEAGDDPSLSNNDLRLVEGRINYVSSPKGKKYCNVELTDTSVTLDDLEKQKSKANLSCMMNKEFATKFGKDSIIRVLAPIKFSPATDKYPESLKLFFPKMVYSMIFVEPEIKEAKTSSDDGEENAKDYFANKEQPTPTPEPENKYVDEQDKPKENKMKLEVDGETHTLDNKKMSKSKVDIEIPEGFEECFGSHDKLDNGCTDCGNDNPDLQKACKDKE